MSEIPEEIEPQQQQKVEEEVNGLNSVDFANLPKAKLGEINVTDYMEKCLDQVAMANGFKNYVIKVVHGSAIGDGFVGLIFKVIISEVDKDQSLTVVLKTPPDNLARRNQFGSMDLFRREILMYNEVLPEFVRFQEERKIPKSAGFHEFPRVYFAEYNEEKDDAIIIMEDLRDSGYKLWDKLKPTTYEHAKLLMNSLGKMHAISFAMKTLKPEVFEKFKGLQDFFAEKFTGPQMAPMFNSSVDQAVGTIDPSNTKLRARVAQLKEQFSETVTWLSDPNNAEPYAVVTHGDCWSNNFMYKYRGANPEKICLIDFQISRYCSPVLDLVYFLLSCTGGDMRKIHYDELLTIYHKSLKDLLDHLGGDSIVQFPFTAFLRQMKKFGKFGVYTAIFIIGMVTTKSEDLPDFDYMAEQMGGTKMEEIDPEKMKEMMEAFMKPNKEFTTRMRESLTDAHRYGYF